MRQAGKTLALLMVILSAVLLMLTALGNLRSGSSEAGCQQLEDSIRRAAVACYAVEGIYPPDLSYLQTRYGLLVNEKRYTVFYEVFGSNLMPDITVLENNA